MIEGDYKLIKLSDELRDSLDGLVDSGLSQFDSRFVFREKFVLVGAAIGDH